MSGSSAAELRQVTIDQHGLDIALDDRPRAPDSESLQDLLDGTSPAQKQQQRLALHPQGASLRLIVRPQDFRLVEVSTP